MSIPTVITDAHRAAAKDIRDALFCARLLHPIPDRVLDRLPPELRAIAAKPYALDILNARQTTIDEILGAIIAYHHAAACDELRAMCRGD